MDVFYFQPPAAADAYAAGAGDRYPASVILEREAHFGDSEGRNATSAEAMTITGHAVAVTFHLAYPPAVSYLSVHSPKLRSEDFRRVPKVVSSEKGLVLLRLALASSPRIPSWRGGSPDHVLDEYFLYRAGRGKPTLSLIPAPPCWTRYTHSMCILPRDNDVDGEFLLADLVSTCCGTDYELHVFSSETAQWIRRLQLQLEESPDVDSRDLPIVSDKAVFLGGGNVGWVDLWRGIKICDVLDEDPVLHFIPLPNAEFDQGQSGNSRRIRDVVVCNGVIKFVEIDCRFRQVLGINDNKKTFKKMTNDLDNADIIHDSEILFRNYHRVEPIPVPDGWKIRTCYRHISWDYWRKEHIVDVDDLLYNSMPEVSDDGARKWALRDLTTAYPTLSIVPDDDDVVYLVSKVKSHDKKAWMIGVHLRKKTLEIQPYSASYLQQPNFLSCAFSKYLN
jgi:hypothetical protein